MATTVKIRRSGTATATPSSLEHGEIAINYADGKVFWKDASNVITSFTFQSYALASHTHAASDITSGTLDAARLPLATTGAAGAVIVGTGLGVSSGTVSVTYGTTSGTACEGNDARLSDTRTPTDNTVSTAKIQDAAVTYAKLQNVSTTDRLLGRSTAGAGVVEEITCTAFGRSLIDDADAAAARTTLSVQPTADPAFTGAATFAGNVQINVTNALLDTAGNLRVFTTDSQAADKGGQIGLGGANGSAGSFDPWSFAVIKGAKENSTSGNLAGYVVFATASSGGVLGERLRISSTGTATFAGQVLVTAGSGSSGSYKPGVAISGDDDTGIHQVSGNANTLSLVTGGTERVRVDASGNVGIGAAPTQKLDVAGADAAVSVGTGSYGRVQLSGGNALGYLYGSFVSLGDGIHLGYNYYANAAGTGVVANSSGETSRITAGYGFVAIATSSAANTAPTEKMRVNGAGEVLIGTTTDNGAYLLQVNSQIYATNATIATSDARFKTNVESIAEATSVIESLRPVAFDFIPQEDRNFATERQVGLIAQEAQEALAGTDYADSVVAQCGDHLGLAYEKLVPVLIKALQESNARIAALEERLNHG